MSEKLKISRSEAEQAISDKIKEVEAMIQKVHDHADFEIAFEDFVPELNGWREIVKKTLLRIFPTNEQSVNFDHTSNGGFLIAASSNFDEFQGYSSEIKKEVGYLKTCIKLLPMYEEPTNHTQFFPAGSQFTAFQHLTKLISEANQSVVLVDGYIDSDTLGILSAANSKVTFNILTKKQSNKPLLQSAISAFQKQHGSLEVRQNEDFHDRFLIIDSKKVYQPGGSLKDLGGKAATLTEIQTDQLANFIIQSVQIAWAKSPKI